MSKDGMIAEEWFLVGLVGCCITGFVGFAAGNLKGLSAEDGAAWVQAVFSIVGIGIAVWLSHTEHRKQRAMKKAEERDSVLGVAVLINHGVALIEALSSHDDGKPTGSAVHALHVIAERLESLELIVRPNPVVLRSSFKAANNIRVYTEDAERGMLEDHSGLAGKTAKAADQILKFYGLSKTDLPEEGGRWVATVVAGDID